MSESWQSSGKSRLWVYHMNHMNSCSGCNHEHSTNGESLTFIFVVNILCDFKLNSDVVSILNTAEYEAHFDLVE